MNCTALYVWCCLMMFALFYMWPFVPIFSLVVCINIIVQNRWPIQWAFASLAAFRHVLVFNCYYSYLFYVVLENKIWWWWWWWFDRLTSPLICKFLQESSKGLKYDEVTLQWKRNLSAVTTWRESNSAHLSSTIVAAAANSLILCGFSTFWHVSLLCLVSWLKYEMSK